jgi:hypothetical protein
LFGTQGGLLNVARFGKSRYVFSLQDKRQVDKIGKADGRAVANLKGSAIWQIALRIFISG